MKEEENPPQCGEDHADMHTSLGNEVFFQSLKLFACDQRGELAVRSEGPAPRKSNPQRSAGRHPQTPYCWTCALKTRLCVDVQGRRHSGTNSSETCQEVRTEDEDTRPKEMQQTQETVKINAHKQQVRDGDSFAMRRSLRQRRQHNKYCERMQRMSTRSGRSKEKIRQSSAHCGAKHGGRWLTEQRQQLLATRRKTQGYEVN